MAMPLLWTACNNAKNDENTNAQDSIATPELTEMEKKVNEFVRFRLTTDTSLLTDKERQMLPLLFEAAKIMDKLYWKQSLADTDTIVGKITDEAMRKFYAINYGPWERLNGNKPFVDGIGEKPAGANFYPVDMTAAEFEAFTDKNKTSLYTILRRDESGKLISIPYSEAYKVELTEAANYIRQASELAEDAGLKNYLSKLAVALLKNNYFESDMAWMDMKTNTIDFVCGPIENYEDALFGYKAAFEAFILIKDKEWSAKLEKYAALLPDLQKSLPVDNKYKQDAVGSNSDLNAYDVVFYAGDCNAGSKTIAINLPNDEKVQQKKGSRRLQLKNSIQAKFENILMPIAVELMDSALIANIKFDSFFQNVMFHEVAHGLGIKNVLGTKQTVREALKEQYSTIEEGKADILGLFMVQKLNEMKQLDVNMNDNYATFMAGLFRSIRFGASSSHGKANLICFNYFKEKQVFTRSQNGKYSIDFAKMQTAMNTLSNDILVLQGDGSYDKVAEFIKKYLVEDPQLMDDLKRLEEKNIPVDIVFEQGTDVLGL